MQPQRAWLMQSLMTEGVEGLLFPLLMSASPRCWRAVDVLLITFHKVSAWCCMAGIPGLAWPGLEARGIQAATFCSWQGYKRQLAMSARSSAITVTPRPQVESSLQCSIAGASGMIETIVCHYLSAGGSLALNVQVHAQFPVADKMIQCADTLCKGWQRGSNIRYAE